jgi:hypothetical protein
MTSIAGIKVIVYSRKGKRASLKGGNKGGAEENQFECDHNMI